jgi:hypothetical protein
MPLASTAQAPTGTFGDMSFLMADGDRLVRVDVSRELMAHITGSRWRLPEDGLAALEKARSRIEQIASAKYDAGDYLRYANGYVVSVRMSDWARPGLV